MKRTNEECYRIKKQQSLNEKEIVNSYGILPEQGNTKDNPLDLFKVTFTEVIERTEMLTTIQINALLNQSKVKSIKIEK